MLNIEIIEGEQRELLQKFKDAHYDLADREHYGDELPDFRKESYTIIAREDGKIVGFIFMLIDTGVGIIDALLVDYDKHRAGIGTTLLKNAEDLAKKNGCHIMRLETGREWSARKFYEKHGYTLRAELKNYYGNRDFVLLDKLI